MRVAWAGVLAVVAMGFSWLLLHAETPDARADATAPNVLSGDAGTDASRTSDAARRRWLYPEVNRWRPAIENYVSAVKPGNQIALNSARVPFAGYLNSMHSRIHPIFSDTFLPLLNKLAPDGSMSDPKMFVRLEIVLSGDGGHVVKMGVVKTSGVTAFDIAALESVQRASPFGKPLDAIVSGDGNVYLHWEFHRDPIYACLTAGARPFLISAVDAGLRD